MVPFSTLCLNIFNSVLYIVFGLYYILLSVIIISQMAVSISNYLSDVWILIINKIILSLYNINHNIIGTFIGTRINF